MVITSQLKALNKNSSRGTQDNSQTGGGNSLSLKIEGRQFIQKENSNMGNEAVLHFFCGKMAAGKSTLAKRLAEKANGVLLVEDELLLQLYPEEIVDVASYAKYSRRLKSAISSHIKELLKRGTSVVLDFPGNTPDQRKWFRELFEGASVSHQLHFLEVSDEICKVQLRERSKGKAEGTAFTSDADFDAITKYFQPPTKEEGFNIVEYAART